MRTPTRLGVRPDAHARTPSGASNFCHTIYYFHLPSLAHWGPCGEVCGWGGDKAKVSAIWSVLGLGESIEVRGVVCEVVLNERGNEVIAVDWGSGCEETRKGKRRNECTYGRSPPACAPAPCARCPWRRPRSPRASAAPSGTCRQSPVGDNGRTGLS